MSPRQRDAEQHALTCQQILAIARQQMQTGGTAALSLRSIAREMALTAPALYRYFPTLDDLITALLVEAFSAFASHLEQTQQQYSAAPQREQLVAVLLAYREWALTHPVDFQLIYGNPLPGYHAPRDVTVPIVVRGFRVIVGLLDALLQAGELRPRPPYDHVPPAFAAAAATQNYPVAPLAYYLGIVGWGQLHGLIMLELFNHLQPVVGDAAAHYREQIANLLVTFGVDAS